MNLNNVLMEKGELNFENEFLSLRIVKEALSNKFKFVIQEESTKYLSCKIYRMARLFGAPVPFPNPNLDLEIVSTQDESKIKYRFLSYDYHLLIAAIVVINLGSGIVQNFGSTEFGYGMFEVALSSMAFIILGFVGIKLDSMYFMHLIKKNFNTSIRSN